MTSIGIVGAGVAGLHLALYLQKHGVAVTLYADRTPDEVRAGQLPNTQSFMGQARARDVELGINHWDLPERDTIAVRIGVAGAPPLAFTGQFDPPSMFIDMRVYLPRLMEDFAERGGAIVVAPCTPENVGRIAESHALMVVATGRGGLSGMFPRLAERSPYEVAQRRLVGGLFRGVRLPDPVAIGYDIVPGCGELLEMRMHTQQGGVVALLVEAIPGGPFEPATRLRYEDDPAAFDAAMLAIVREHMPTVYARTDPATFGATGPLDTIGGGVVPTVRSGFIRLPGDRFAMAIGDTLASIDPVSGQGGNAAARSGWLLGELVTAHAHAGGRFDEAFCAHAAERIWDGIRAAVEWTNAFLQPPSPQLIGVLVAASQNQALADRFCCNFDDADRQWAVLSSPEATAAFIASSGAA